MKLPETQTPKFIQLIQWVLNPLQLMETSAKAHGDCFRLSLIGSKPMVFFSNPQAIQEIFTAAPEKFDAGKNRIVKPLQRRTISDITRWRTSPALGGAEL